MQDNAFLKCPSACLPALFFWQMELMLVEKSRDTYRNYAECSLLNNVVKRLFRLDLPLFGESTVWFTHFLGSHNFLLFLLVVGVHTAVVLVSRESSLASVCEGESSSEQETEKAERNKKHSFKFLTLILKSQEVWFGFPYPCARRF